MQHTRIAPRDEAPLIVLDTRESIEAAVEALIARLDAMDGDPDLEPEFDADPLELGEQEEGIALPHYGVDQTEGPLNEAAAVRRYQEALRRGEDPTGIYMTRADLVRRLPSCAEVRA